MDFDQIRCICGFDDDDGYTIQCEKCLVWQHVDCVLDGEEEPANYWCEECMPRPVNVQKAIQKQMENRVNAKQDRNNQNERPSASTRAPSAIRRDKEVKVSPRKPGKGMIKVRKDSKGGPKGTLGPTQNVTSGRNEVDKGKDAGSSNETDVPSSPTNVRRIPKEEAKKRLGRPREKENRDFFERDVGSYVKYFSKSSTGKMIATLGAFWGNEALSGTATIRYLERPKDPLREYIHDPFIEPPVKSAFARELDQILANIKKPKSAPSPKKSQATCKTEEDFVFSDPFEHQYFKFGEDSCLLESSRFLHLSVSDYISKVTRQLNRRVITLSSKPSDNDVDMDESNEQPKPEERVLPWGGLDGWILYDEADVAPVEDGQVVENSNECVDLVDVSKYPIVMDAKAFENALGLVDVECVSKQVESEEEDDSPLKVPRNGLFPTVDIPANCLICDIKGTLCFLSDISSQFGQRNSFQKRKRLLGYLPLSNSTQNDISSTDETSLLLPPFVFAHPASLFKYAAGSALVDDHKVDDYLVVDGREVGCFDGRFVRSYCGGDKSVSDKCNAHVRSVFVIQDESDQIAKNPETPSVTVPTVSHGLPATEQVRLCIFSTRPIPQHEEIVINSSLFSSCRFFNYPCICEDTSVCRVAEALSDPRLEESLQQEEQSLKRKREERQEWVVDMEEVHLEKQVPIVDTEEENIDVAGSSESEMEIRPFEQDETPHVDVVGVDSHYPEPLDITSESLDSSISVDDGLEIMEPKEEFHFDPLDTSAEAETIKRKWNEDHPESANSMDHRLLESAEEKAAAEKNNRMKRIRLGDYIKTGVVKSGAQEMMARSENISLESLNESSVEEHASAQSEEIVTDKPLLAISTIPTTTTVVETISVPPTVPSPAPKKSVSLRDFMMKKAKSSVTSQPSTPNTGPVTAESAQSSMDEFLDVLMRKEEPSSTSSTAPPQTECDATPVNDTPTAHTFAKPPSAAAPITQPITTSLKFNTSKITNMLVPNIRNVLESVSEEARRASLSVRDDEAPILKKEVSDSSLDVKSTKNEKWSLDTVDASPSLASSKSIDAIYNRRKLEELPTIETPVEDKVSDYRFSKDVVSPAKYNNEPPRTAEGYSGDSYRDSTYRRDSIKDSNYRRTSDSYDGQGYRSRSSYSGKEFDSRGYAEYDERDKDRMYDSRYGRYGERDRRSGDGSYSRWEKERDFGGYSSNRYGSLEHRYRPGSGSNSRSSSPVGEKEYYEDSRYMSGPSLSYGSGGSGGPYYGREDRFTSTKEPWKPHRNDREWEKPPGERKPFIRDRDYKEGGAKDSYK